LVPIEILAIRPLYWIFLLRIAHAQNGHISTPGLKSDVTIVFHDPHVIEDAKISAICVYLKQI